MLLPFLRAAALWDLFLKIMSLTKKIRFEVFKRDGFKCQYCGKFPPDVILEVDHINPVSKGGTDDMNNLVTSCFDCNRGKKNIELSQVPTSFSENIEMIRERELQYNEYQYLMESIRNRILNECNIISNIFNMYYQKIYLTNKFLFNTVKPFIEKLGYMEVSEAMHLACSKSKNSNHATRYFCGICWNKIKNKKSC